MYFAQAFLLGMAMCAFFYQVFKLMELHGVLCNRGKANVTPQWYGWQFVALFVEFCFILSITGVHT